MFGRIGCDVRLWVHAYVAEAEGICNSLVDMCLVFINPCAEVSEGAIKDFEE